MKKYVELVDPKVFAIAALNSQEDTFVIYVVLLLLKVKNIINQS